MKKTIILFIITISLLFPILILTETVNSGYIKNDRFFCGFDSATVGSHYVNDTVGTQSFIRIVPNHIYPNRNLVRLVAGDYIYTVNSSANATNLNPFNIYLDIDSNSISFNATNGVYSDTFDLRYGFYSFEGLYLGGLRLISFYPSYCKIMIINNLGSAIGSYDYCGSNNMFYINFTLSTKIMNITVFGQGTRGYTLPYSSYVREIRPVFVVGGSMILTIDDITAKYNTIDPWVIDYNSVGNIENTYDTLNSYSLVLNTHYVFEWRYYAYPFGTTIKQIMLQVGDLTTLSLLSFNLFINNNPMGTYTTYYHIGYTYYLLWTLNKAVDSGDIIYELSVNKISGSPQIDICSVHYDNDGDTKQDYRYSINKPTKINGIYDGDTLFAEDIIYQMWYTGSSMSELPDMSSFKTIGSYPISSSTNYKSMCNKIRYDIEFTGDIQGVDYFFVTKDIDSIDKNNFFLSFHGIHYSPVSLSYYTGIGANAIYFLRWDFRTLPISVLRDKMLLEFTSNYWHTVSPNIENSDLDNDGDIQYKNTYSHTDLYDGDTYNYDFNYIIYYNNEILNNPELPFDYVSLNLYNYDGTNTSGNLMYYRNNTVVVEYGIKDLTQQNSIHVYNTATKTQFNVTNQLPYDIPITKPNGVLGFIATTKGNYNVTIKIGNTWLRSKNFDITIDANEQTNKVYTQPPMTKDTSPYTIIYKYYNSLGHAGYLLTFKDSSEITYNQSFNKNPITVNTTGSIPVMVNGNQVFNHHIKMFYYYGGYYMPLNIMHTHFILDSSLNNNIFVSSLYDYKVGTNITIYGTHNLLMANVHVFINGQENKYVGDNQHFSYNYMLSKLQKYNISLVLIENNNTRIVLSYVEFTSKSAIDGKKEIAGFSLEAPYTYIAGTILTLVLLILPSIVLGKTGFQSEILKYVPLFSGILGFIVSCMIGFFPWYAIFGLVLVLVIVLAVIYQSKKG